MSCRCSILSSPRKFFKTKNLEAKYSKIRSDGLFFKRRQEASLSARISQIIDSREVAGAMPNSCPAKYCKRKTYTHNLHSTGVTSRVLEARSSARSGRTLGRRDDSAVHCARYLLCAFVICGQGQMSQGIAIRLWKTQEPARHCELIVGLWFRCS